MSQTQRYQIATQKFQELDESLISKIPNVCVCHPNIFNCLHIFKNFYLCQRVRCICTFISDLINYFFAQKSRVIKNAFDNRIIENWMEIPNFPMNIFTSDKEKV